MRSIVFRLTAIMLCIALVSVIITVGAAVVISGNQLREMAHEEIEAQTMAEAHDIEGWVDVQAASIAAIANILSNYTDFSDESLQPAFKTVADSNSAYNDVYMGFPDGWAVMASGADVAELQEMGWFANERGWYQLAMTDTNSPHITAPYIDTSSGELCITAAHAVKKGGEVLGVAGIDILLPEINEMIMAVDLNGTGYAMLLDADGNVLAHPGAYAPDMRAGTFHNFAEMEGGLFADLWAQAKSADSAYLHDDAQGVSKFYTVHSIELVNWKLLTIVPSNNIDQLMIDLILIVLPITLVIMAIAAVIIIYTSRSVIAKPLKKVTEAAEALSVGDIEIEGLDEGTTPTKNEVVILERAFHRMVESFKKQAYVLARIAEGDYTTRVEVRSEKDVINSAIELVLDGTLDALGQVASAGVQVADSSKSIAENAHALAMGAADQAATVEQLSSSVSVIAENTKENSAMAKRAASLANTIKDNAEKGSSQMNEMMEAVKQINQSSQSIGKVIKVIDDIAFQTNILALNAAVEAARAGQHGKGFAVVAEEVRNLAAKSADAAKDTGGLISDSMEKAELGSRIASETAASLSEIVDGINESTKIVSDIAMSSEEQTLSIDQINTAIEQVAHVVQKNSQTAESSADAAKSMSGQSEVLEDLIKQFQLRDEARKGKSLPPAQQ